MERKEDKPQLLQQQSSTASFFLGDDCFVKDDIAIDSTGVAKRNSNKSYTIVSDELELGPYIGKGANSVVRIAQHAPTNTVLALKIVNAFDESKRKQFVNEIRCLYDINSPYLVSFFGAFMSQGALSLAMEYMDGGSIQNVIQQVGVIPENVVSAMVWQILKGLELLKDMKMVHRDIKPGNILLNSEGRVKVADFGISSALQSTIAMCHTFVGTAKYMSPERIINQPYDYVADIWSFGLIVFEGLTGHYPYPEQASYFDMVQTILESPAPVISDEFSNNCRDFLSKCVAKDPKDRCQASELLKSPWINFYDDAKATDTVHQWIEEVRRSMLAQQK